MARVKKPKLGRPPVEGETATVRVELKVTPSQLAAWQAVMASKGIKTVKQLVVESVEVFGARDEEGDLADLGREVLALARNYESQ